MNGFCYEAGMPSTRPPSPAPRQEDPPLPEMIATAREALRKAQEALDETLPCAVDEAEARQPCAARLSSGTWARTR